MRENPVPLARVAQRQQQHRNAVRKRRGDARVGVLGAGPILHSEHPRRPAIRNPRVAIADAHPHALLAADNRAYSHSRRRLYHRRSRERAQILYPLDLQYLGYGVNGSHMLCLSLCSLCALRLSRDLCNRALAIYRRWEYTTPRPLCGRMIAEY